MAAGIVAVMVVVLTKEDGTIKPFTATVVPRVNPVPASVTRVAVLIGPAFGVTAPKVGAGGVVICTTIAFESAGLAVGVSTCTVAVPTLPKSDAGTVAYSEPLIKEAEREAPFHSIMEFEAKPDPATVMIVDGDPATIELGVTEVITGVEAALPGPPAKTRRLSQRTGLKKRVERCSNPRRERIFVKALFSLRDHRISVKNKDF